MLDKFNEEKPVIPKPVSVKITDNITFIKTLFMDSFDVSSRNFTWGDVTKSLEFTVFFINGLTDKNLIETHVLKSLSGKQSLEIIDQYDNIHEVAGYIQSSMLTALEIINIFDLQQAVEALLSGKSIIFLNGLNYCFELDTRKWKDRNITEPTSENSIRGPHEGFTETLVINTALIRRRLKTSELIFELVKIGTLTKTDVVICFIKGIANDKIVEEVRYRLSKIQMDSILDSGYIEQFIEDEPLSLFATIGHTEKPDTAVGKLLEGRIIVLVDGSPSVLTLPFLMIENFVVSGDYYNRPITSTFFRLIRFSTIFIVLFLPGFYISVQTFHPDLLPTHLLITMAAAKEGVPFPSFLEILLLSALFEVLKEAGKRMPKSIGQAVSIVGALVIGQAAVDAGFVSNPAVMITALAGICGFVIYKLDESVTPLRFLMILASALAGLFGMLIVSLFILIHLVSIRSFGAPFMSPFSPTSSDALMKDTLFRAPLWSMRNRPRSINWKTSIRNTTNKPSPDK